MLEDKKKNKWLALIAVMLTYAFAFLTRYIYSPLMLDMSESLNITITKAGFLMTGFMIGYLSMQIPGGLLADRLQPKYILLIDLLVGGVCTALISKVETFALGLLLRVIVGISCGSVYSCSSKIITYYFDKEELSIAMGCLLGAGPFGIVLANSVGEIFVSNYGWRTTFVCVAIFGLMAFILMLLFVDPFKSTNKKLEVSELFVGIRAYLSDKQQIILGLSGFMLMFVTVGFAHWTNSYLEEVIGLTGEQGGMVLTYYSIAGIIFSCLSGKIAEKLNIKPKKFIIYTEAVMIPLTILFAICKSYIALVCVGIVYGIFTYVPSTHYVTLAMARADEKSIAVTAALQNLIFQCGGLVQSALIGVLIDNFGYTALWISFTIACILEVVFACLFKEK